MPGMIERVARAICESIGDDWFREGPGGLLKAYEMEARAAIEAMREPTDAMKEACLGEGHETDWWKEFIDIALKESA